jgi:hypothetical protein
MMFIEEGNDSGRRPLAAMCGFFVRGLEIQLAWLIWDPLKQRL